MPQESEQDVIDRLRLWNAMREPAPLVKLSSVQEVLADALIVMDSIRLREKKLQNALRKARAHTGHLPEAPRELLAELLASIQRICDEAASVTVVAEPS